MAKLAYTASEKLLAEMAADALRDLDQVFMAMRQSAWHESDDKNLRLLYLGVDAALKAQHRPYEAALAIIGASFATEIERLPAWNGYPADKSTVPDTGTDQ